MEETNVEKELANNEDNQKIPGKNALNSKNKTPNETRSNIIIGIVAGVLILSTAATFIGASISESKNNERTPTPSFSWDIDKSGFYDRDGNFINAGKFHKFVDKKDNADKKYMKLTSVEIPVDAFSYVFPSFFNNVVNGKTEAIPISAVGKEFTYDDDFENNFDTIKKDIFETSIADHGIAELYFQSLYREVSDYAFYECVDLEKVEFRSFASGKQEIGQKAFAECKKLKNVVLSNNLTTIGSKAFENDISLKSIDLPIGLKKIESSVFCGTSLEDINYAGTKSDWERITKSADWSNGLESCKIHFLKENITESI